MRVAPRFTESLLNATQLFLNGLALNGWQFVSQHTGAITHWAIKEAPQTGFV